MNTGDGIFRWEQSWQYMEWSLWRGVSGKFFGISFSLLLRSWGYGLSSGQSFTQWVVPPLRPRWCLSSAKGLPPTPNCPLIFILFLYYVLKMLSNFNIQLGVLCWFFVEGLVPSFRRLWTHTHRCQTEEDNHTHSRYTWCCAQWLSGCSKAGRGSLTQGSARLALRAWEDRMVLWVAGKAYCNVCHLLF